MHEGVWLKKIDKITLWELRRFFPNIPFVLIDSSFMDRATPATVYHGAIWYVAYTIKTHWTYAWMSLVQKNIFLQNDSYEN